jgi:hypothetical protein
MRFRTAASTAASATTAGLAGNYQIEIEKTIVSKRSRLVASTAASATTKGAVCELIFLSF